MERMKNVKSINLLQWTEDISFIKMMSCFPKIVTSQPFFLHVFSPLLLKYFTLVHWEQSKRANLQRLSRSLSILTRFVWTECNLFGLFHHALVNYHNLISRKDIVKSINRSNTEYIIWLSSDTLHIVWIPIDGCHWNITSIKSTASPWSSFFLHQTWIIIRLCIVRRTRVLFMLYYLKWYFRLKC